jgi:hypothetical protein
MTFCMMFFMVYLMIIRWVLAASVTLGATEGGRA